MAVDLKDFIKATLLDIVTAIKETQQEAPAGAIIAPTVSDIPQNEAKVFWDNNHGLSIVSNVEFDVAISASSNTIDSKNRAIGIQVIESVLGAAYQKRKSESNSVENISRIKFSVPVVFPPKVPSLDNLKENQ